MKTVLVLGASSTIAQETVRQLAKKKMDFVLTGRKTEDLQALKNDLEIRHDVKVHVKQFNALDFDRHELFFNEVLEEFDGIDGLLLMYGAMADQKEAENSFALSRNMIDVNYTSAVSILNIAANYFEQQKRGFICAVSSVAGDRGRQSNYIYGSTKAGLSVYMEGLRNRLHQSGVQVLTVKPGMVDTKMTYGVVEDSPLLASPVKVAADISKSIAKRKDVVYTPWFWVIIMLVIKLIPEWIFKRTDI
ncbi:SDR family oxidoreductase [Virgibacillus halodenitrificans]|uniref:SDR family oxidoreductase n=1 Tax=Virgibacillus halodenitrificans TaxID=1482 RepID=UPI001EEF6AD1|nr:SDR family oxidoreductase [Virgibacillus halodenitrificans]MCG1027007.1 SDR family oxidoreductase [Virgibacillus halodenitrificans]